MSDKENLNQETAETIDAAVEAATEEGATQAVKAETADKPKKDKAKKEKAKAEKNKKPGVGQRIGRFFRELKAELKKVSWPTRIETLKKTGIVIACCIVVGVIVWIFDSIANGLVNALLNLFGG